MKTTRNWLVVANAARARVLEALDEGGVTHVADLVHPASRMKGEDLAAGRPGHIEGAGHGLGSTYEPRTGPRERERERFALQVARMLDEGVAQGRCDGLTLVASDPFLGELRSHLGHESRKRVLRTVAADYTTLRDDEILDRVVTA